MRSATEAEHSVAKSLFAGMNLSFHQIPSIWLHIGVICALPAFTSTLKFVGTGYIGTCSDQI
jgi:hypothetical protein